MLLFVCTETTENNSGSPETSCTMVLPPKVSVFRWNPPFALTFTWTVFSGILEDEAGSGLSRQPSSSSGKQETEIAENLRLPEETISQGEEEPDRTERSDENEETPMETSNVHDDDKEEKKVELEN